MRTPRSSSRNGKEYEYLENDDVIKHRARVSINGRRWHPTEVRKHCQGRHIHYCQPSGFNEMPTGSGWILNGTTVAFSRRASHKSAYDRALTKVCRTSVPYGSYDVPGAKQEMVHVFHH